MAKVLEPHQIIATEFANSLKEMSIDAKPYSYELHSRSATAIVITHDDGIVSITIVFQPSCVFDNSDDTEYDYNDPLLLDKLTSKITNMVRLADHGFPRKSC